MYDCPHCGHTVRVTGSGTVVFHDMKGEEHSRKEQARTVACESSGWRMAVILGTQR